MPAADALRSLATLLLGLAAAAVVDRATERRGLVPPGFSPGGGAGSAALARRAAALALLALIFWLGVFGPLATIGTGEATAAFDQVDTPQLFLLHALLAGSLIAWYGLGFLGLPGARERRAMPAAAGGEAPPWSLRAQLGFATPNLATEAAIGVVAGLAAWVVVLFTMIVVGAAAWQLGGDEALPTSPPPMIPWIAGLPVAVRLAVSASAGIVEESFFRGFLQPRVGVGLSTGLFVLAHMSYEQPFMLVGVGLLSLIFSGLVLWRQSIWAAAVAHAVFDAVQLTIVIPLLLRLLPGQGAAGAGPLRMLGQLAGGGW